MLQISEGLNVTTSCGEFHGGIFYLFFFSNLCDAADFAVIKIFWLNSVLIQLLLFALMDVPHF